MIRRDWQAGPRKGLCWEQIVSIAMALVLVVSGSWAVLRYLTEWEGEAVHAAPPGGPATKKPAVSIFATPTPYANMAASPSVEPTPTIDPFQATRDKPLIKPAGAEVRESWQYENEQYLLMIEQLCVDETMALVADIRFKDGSAFNTAFAKDTFGRNYLERTSVIAERNGAMLATSGDYYGYREDGIIVRGGVLYRNEPVREMFCLFSDGRAMIVDETTADIDALLADGLTDTFSFGPALVKDYRHIEDIKSSVYPKNPRTAIGMVEPGHFKLVVVDGRQNGYSVGFDIQELALFMEALGCQIAYNLDGGNTATMYYDGKTISKPSGAGNYERTISDIIYLLP